MTSRLAASLADAPGRLHFKLPPLEWLSRIVSAVLTAVLLLSTAFAIGAAAVTRTAADRIAAVRALSDHLRTARYALVTEHSLERKYRLSPDGMTFVQHRLAAASLVAAMEFVREHSDPEGRRFVDGILAEHRIYLDDTRRLFVATNRNDVQLVTTLQRDHVDPVFEEISGAIDDRAKRQDAAGDRDIDELHSAQNRDVDITMALSLIGLVCLGCFLIIVRTYRRRLEASHDAQVKQLEKAALLDALTGIGNHRAYKHDLVREISRAKRHGETLTLALLDVDDFKVTNDRDGHIHGDRVLVTLAELLGRLRTEDRAYRVGGDEFAVIMPQTALQEANEVVARLQIDVAAALFGNTLSIGLAASDDHTPDAETLQARADAAMYAAKRSGRNGVTAFDESLDGRWLASPATTHNLRQLIASRSIHIVFQPIWDVPQCRVFAYEALARPDPAFGFAGPQDAFDVAERVGRAHELDAVCRDAALARAADLPPGALLFINVSPQSLDHGRLRPSDFVQAVRAAGLEPERVVIEITERSITQVEAVIEAAKKLQELGFRLALDDTGAGNAGLEMLSRLPIKFVKIDRDVVVKALIDKKARGVVAGIIAIATVTDAFVIAEGIETTEMLRFVCNTGPSKETISRGIEGAQGYLLRRPRETFLEPAEMGDVSALLRKYAFDAQSGTAA